MKRTFFYFFIFREKQKYKIAENLNEHANEFRRNPITHNP